MRDDLGRLRANQHVLIHGLAPDFVNGVTKWTSNGFPENWAVWIPGPVHAVCDDEGFLCYCPPETLTVLDLPDHVFKGGKCEHCP